jgi:hypothetical protein
VNQYNIQGFDPERANMMWWYDIMSYSWPIDSEMYRNVDITHTTCERLEPSLQNPVLAELVWSSHTFSLAFSK